MGISQLTNIRKRVWAGAMAGEPQLYQLFRNSILAADRGAFLDAGKWNNFPKAAGELWSQDWNGAGWPRLCVSVFH